MNQIPQQMRKTVGHAQCRQSRLVRHASGNQRAPRVSVDTGLDFWRALVRLGVRWFSPGPARTVSIPLASEPFASETCRASSTRSRMTSADFEFSRLAAAINLICFVMFVELEV